jgi:hypothetical protein
VSTYDRLKTADALIEIAAQIPDDTPWEFVQYALICERLKRFKGSRLQAARSVGISLRCIRMKIILMEEFGFFPTKTGPR